MLSIPKAARGKTTYGNGSYAPNTGRVSAQGVMGYVNREQRKPPGMSKVGQDGYSDTRSGLAAKALHGGQAGGPKPRPPGQWVPGGQQQGGKGGKKPYDNKGRPATSGAGTGGPGAPSLPPTVRVNDAGTLELPYDDQWGMDVIGAMGDYNAQLLELQKEQQQQALQYMNQKKALGQQYDQTKRDTLNVGAGSGAAFSSAYGSSVAKNALNYQNDNNSLDSENANFNLNATQQRAAIQQAFQDMLRQSALARAATAAQDAGTLGYGQDASTEGGKHKHKHKDKDKDHKGKGGKK